MDKREKIIKQLEKIMMESDIDMYNKIRAEREMNNDVDNLVFLGNIDNINILNNISIDTEEYEGYIPFVWVEQEQDFLYFINNKWEDSEKMKNVDIYEDDDISIILNMQTDKVVVNPKKPGVTISIDEKLPLILSKLSRMDVEAVKLIIESDSCGIHDLDEIKKILIEKFGEEEYLESTDKINAIVSEYDRWYKALETLNQIQEDDLDAVNKAISQSYIDEMNEKNDLELVDMGEIYNELVKERNEQNEEESSEEDEEWDEDFDNVYKEEDDDLDIIENDDEEDDDLDIIENDDEEDYEFEGSLTGDPDEITQDEYVEPGLFAGMEDFDYASLYPSPEQQRQSKAIQMMENVKRNEIINPCDVYDPVESYLTTDLDNDETYLHVNKRYGAKMPSLFVKVDESVLEDIQLDQISMFSMSDSNAYIRMEDETDTDLIESFTDTDLISILKVRVSALMDLEDNEGNKPYENDTALNQVLIKLMEAKMWLDIWAKSKE